MILDTKKAIDIEQRFLRQYGGELLFTLTYGRAGISQELFKIGTFQHLLYYHRESEPSRLQSIIAKTSFIKGFLLGYWLAQHRLIRPRVNKKFRYLIFSANTPNQRASAKRIVECEALFDDCAQSSYLHIHNLIWGRTPSDSLLEIRIMRVEDGKDNSSLRQILSAIEPAFRKISSPARCWIRYGIAVSPLIGRLKEGVERLATDWGGAAVYFTNPSEWTSLLAESLRNHGIRTILWHHGILTMLHIGRSRCEEIAVYHPADIRPIRKYVDKKVTVRSQPQITKHILDIHSTIVKNKVGYATNLFTVFGAMRCYEEINNHNFVCAGNMCNEIITDFIRITNLNTLFLKNHPRETITPYKSFISILISKYCCQVNIDHELNDFLNNVDHCICHPSSVAFHLLNHKKRVYIYKHTVALVDRESSLGIALDLVGFSSVEDLMKLFYLSDTEYWSNLTNFLNPQL